MKVWETGMVHYDLQEKRIYAAEIMVTKLMAYFADKTFGNSVKEIFYYTYCLEKKLIHVSEHQMFYLPKAKRIEVTLELDLQTALKANNKEFLRYLANCCLDRSSEIGVLNIKDFDLDAYLKALEHFFTLNKAI